MRLRREQFYLIAGAVLLIASIVLQVAGDNANLLHWSDFFESLAIVTLPQGLAIAVLAVLFPRRLGIAAGLTVTIWIAANQSELAPVFAGLGIVEAGFGFIVVVAMPALVAALCLVPNVLVSRAIGAIGVAFFTLAAVELSVALVKVGGVGAEEDVVHLLDRDPIPQGVTATPTSGRLPDIIYIVPDRYPSASVLRRIYNHDNADFLNALRDRGFAIAEDARANYLRTYYSLASSMNMQYLDPVLTRLDGKTEREEPLYELIRSNLVTERLRRMGYRTVLVPSWWDGTRDSTQADEVVQFYTMFFAGELGVAVLERNPFVMIALYRMMGGSKCEAFKRQLNFLGHVGGDERPTFVVAHLMVPHMPILTDAEGNCISEILYPTTPEGITWDQFTDAFNGFLTYFNNRILEIFDRQIGDNPNPVIFVLQSDEGPYPPALHDSLARAFGKQGADRYADFDWRQASDTELATKFGILNAIYFDGGRLPEIPASLSPVNNWRVIFSYLDGVDHARLPDRYFIYPNARNPYSAIEITERMKAIPR